MNYKEKQKRRLKEVCKSIRMLRLEKNLSQSEIADKLKIQQASYNQLENGKIKLTLEKLYEIADLFGLPIEYFLNKNVNGLIDSLIEKNEDLFRIREIGKFKPEFPELTSESFVERLIEKEKEIEKYRSEHELVSKLNSYLSKENRKAKMILKELLDNNKTKKQIDMQLQIQIAEILAEN